jgi:hypothetical protein
VEKAIAEGTLDFEPSKEDESASRVCELECLSRKLNLENELLKKPYETGSMKPRKQMLRCRECTFIQSIQGGVT